MQANLDQIEPKQRNEAPFSGELHFEYMNIEVECAQIELIV